MDKAILTCALTGVLTNPKQYPVPVTPAPGDIVLGVSNDATVTTQAAPTNPGP